MVGMFLFGEDVWCNGKILKNFVGENMNINWQLKVCDLLKDAIGIF